jgi:ABC-type multidrug transport system fused ATPase/permease subunit
VSRDYSLLSQWTFSVLTLPLIIYMMARELGPSAYVGVAAFLGSTMLSTLLSYAAMPFNRRMQECRDVRSALLSDAVKGVGVLKAYACEAAWGRRVSAARRAELAQLRAVRYLGAGTSLICGMLAQGTPFAIFSWFVLVQHEHLDAPTAFVALAWIQQLQWSINALPGLVYAWAFLAPSLRRLCAVIDIDIDSDAPPPAAPPAGGYGQHGRHGQQGRQGRQGREGRPSARPPINAALVPAAAAEDEEEPPLAPLLAHHLPRGVVVALRGARLTPSVSSSATDGGRSGGSGSDNDSPPLAPLPNNGGTRYSEVEPRSCEVEPRYREVELQVEAAELLILCGAVGSGKSTLLAALAGARPLAAGTRAATRRRAYVAQQPFLMRESVRRNVLFGQPFEAARYERALAMAALEPDLRAMPRGDETDVGECGHALSGGQRARVAFARAVYAEAEALFLDDIFAAVDAQVGRRLWA